MNAQTPFKIIALVGGSGPGITGSRTTTPRVVALQFLAL
jgi:hypothetical protein